MRRKPRQINMFDELIVDNFAGGGGASTGIELALGRTIDLAINHDKEAIAMHQTNHPYTKHFCESVWEVDPKEITGGRPVGLAWFSPDCKHWPIPTHGDPKSDAVKNGDLLPWRTAAECIDWSIPCPSIFEREKPLTENTLRRIARGVIKYVLQAKQPFIVTCNHAGESFRGQGLEEPFKTLTASRDAHGVVVPTLVQTGYGERPGQAPRVPGLEKPLGTIVADGQKHALIAANLIQSGFGEAPGSPPRCIDIQKPLGTVMAGSIKHALAVATLIKHYGGNYKAAGIDLNEPIHTITSTDHHAVVSAHVLRHFGTSTGSDLNEPIRTVMSDGGGKSGLIVSHLTRFRGDNQTNSVEEPIPTVVASGVNIGEVRAFLTKYYGEGIGQSLNEPAATLTSKDRLALVTINSVEYVIADIGMRMLQPHELFKAQGFPDDYVIAPEINGKKLTKTAQVRMVGNSVSPCVSEALVRANMPRKERARKRA
ncbi:MAG TPA: DNA cytosine methyltransferase [Drouetiella sp.]